MHELLVLLGDINMVARKKSSRKTAKRRPAKRTTKRKTTKRKPARKRTVKRTTRKTTRRAPRKVYTHKSMSTPSVTGKRKSPLSMIQRDVIMALVALVILSLVLILAGYIQIPVGM